MLTWALLLQHANDSCDTAFLGCEKQTTVCKWHVDCVFWWRESRSCNLPSLLSLQACKFQYWQLLLTDEWLCWTGNKTSQLDQKSAEEIWVKRQMEVAAIPKPTFTAQDISKHVLHGGSSKLARCFEWVPVRFKTWFFSLLQHHSWFHTSWNVWKWLSVSSVYKASL